MESKLPYLNVGCGYSYHKDWVNVDFVSTGEGVMAHNLVNGIPFPDQSFEVVYHSHVLEHFTKSDGRKFIGECYRVLKPGGTIRIAVPDLGKIINEYVRLTAELKEKSDDPYIKASYEWILIEMYDQTVRNKSGGAMLDYLKQDKLINEDFILQRCGYEIRGILDSIKKHEEFSQSHPKVESPGIKAVVKKNISRIRSIPSGVKNILKRKLMDENYEYYYQLGKFRSSGEIHQWMYDEYSLKNLLAETGFKNFTVRTAHDSAIPEWNQFQLETVDGNVRKPDSLFVEGTK